MILNTFHSSFSIFIDLKILAIESVCSRLLVCFLAYVLFVNKYFIVKKKKKVFYDFFSVITVIIVLRYHFLIILCFCYVKFSFIYVVFSFNFFCNFFRLIVIKIKSYLLHTIKSKCISQIKILQYRISNYSYAIFHYFNF